MPNKPITKPILVAVEGLDYLHLLLKSPLSSDLVFQQSVLLWDFKEGGVTLREFLGAVRLQRNFGMVQKLGLIFDAELDASSAADSVRDNLRNNRFVTPLAAKQLELGTPSVAYLIMPDGAKAGCLENACLQACSKSHLLPCAEQFLQCVGGLALNANWQAKLKVHAMIAGSGNNPAMTLGQSAATDLWDFANPALQVMIDFVRSLY